ncbi:tyrosine-type recombinase/integrase [Burkholderia multivorans]|uniref:tyrosine-type recombinase/integrase n=1 Tax=Burkholderia multivorans TaxID=87883 RepID=UPI0021C0D223|nr:integrase arm-type DNA-binding domain-containing protein [Burkholderia multivorans]
MRHVNYTLTPLKLNAAKPQAKAYKITDGGGLFVRVSPAGTKTWCYGYAFADKRKEVTLGQYPEVSIKDARDRHFAARQQIAQGIDPAAAKRDEKEAMKRAAEASAYVFKTFAARWMAERLANASDVYRRKVLQRLDLHVFPLIGTKQIEDVTPRDVLGIIERLSAKPHTAEKVRGTVSAIFDFGIAKLVIDRNPAAPFKGEITRPPHKHHRHLSEKELGTFWNALATFDESETDPSTVRCARLIAWSMCRKSECTNARWDEIDLDAGTWTISAERMKMRREHRVYLPTQAVAMLREQYELTGQHEHVFSTFGRRSSPLAVATVSLLFKRLPGVPQDFAPHGLRGTAATLLREHGFKRDCVELLLAHGESGVAAAYHHHELADERRRALQYYADRIDALAAGTTNVVGIKSRAA